MKSIIACSRGSADRMRGLSGPQASKLPAASSSRPPRTSSGQPMRSMITLTGSSWATSVTASNSGCAAMRSASASARCTSVACTPSS